jgi:hypothetical protein
MAWKQRTIFKTLKNWLLGVLYRYIHFCIDTNVLKLVLVDFEHFVSIYTGSVSIQKCLHKVRTAYMIRNMLACIDTYVYVLKNQQAPYDSKHACMLRYISVKISRLWCLYRYISCLYRYKGQDFQSLTLVKVFVSIQTIICIDTLIEKLCLNLLILFSL